MSLYNMLFGRNPQTALLLAVIGLRENDVERLRDVFASDDGSTIAVYTRTGGGNREAYPNLAMRKRPEWRGSVDDDFDSTYCTDTFSVPEQWRADVTGLRDVMKHGLRAEFMQHVAATLDREPTEDDKAFAEYQAESAALAKTKHKMANGHTFVPLDDSAMKTALEWAEKNDGKLRSCWGILPIALTVETNRTPYPNARAESDRLYIIRAEIDYSHKWAMDLEYWEHCKTRFLADFPKAMGAIEESLQKHLKAA